MFRKSQSLFKYISRLGFNTLAVFILCSTFLLASAQAGQGTITGAVVNVRSGPGSSNEVAGTLLKDTKVEILATSGEWSKIKYAGTEGWVASQYVNPTAAASSSNTTSSTPASTTPVTVSRQIQVINGPISSRTGPATTYSKSESLPDKAIYKVISEKDGWFQIQLSNGSSAYVASWLVQEIGTTPTAPATIAATPAAAAVRPATTNLVATASPKTSTAAPSVLLNQQALQFEVPPRIENGRTLVPLRAIFEAMGASVDWNSSTRTVTAKKGNTTVILPMGSTSPTVNGQPYKLEVAAKIVNDRTLAPLRFVGEAFGGQVNWDAQTRTITINYTAAPTPKAVKIKEAQVNLRETPATTANKVDTAQTGEILTVLTEQNGWYQVSHNGKVAWVASWVVEAIAETAEPNPPAADPENPPTAEPTTPTPTPTPPVSDTTNEPENVLHLSRVRDTGGIRIMITSKLKMEPKIKESSGSIQYEFTERPLMGLNFFEEKMGSETLKAKATSQDKNTLIEVSLPSDISYRMSTEEDGKQLVIFIPNYITSMEKSAFGSVGDRLIISTLCPVTGTGNINGDKLEVTLPGLSLKKGSSYSFSSDLINSVKVETSPSNANDVLLTFNTTNLSKYSFATSGSNSDLNIILMRNVNQTREKLVVLDAGHGGRDSGARGSLIDEKVINLDVAQKAGELLKQKGIRVEYSRTDDSLVELEQISNIANTCNASLFVSIHCNSNTASDKCGTETYFYAPLTTPDLYVQRDERNKLATLLQNELASKLQRTNRGVKEANFSVLRNTKMPSALIEMAFISNPTEQALLMQDEFRNLAAQAIANAVEQYMSGI